MIRDYSRKNVDSIFCESVSGGEKKKSRVMFLVFRGDSKTYWSLIYLCRQAQSVLLDCIGWQEHKWRHLIVWDVWVRCHKKVWHSSARRLLAVACSSPKSNVCVFEPVKSGRNVTEPLGETFYNENWHFSSRTRLRNFILRLVCLQLQLWLCLFSYTFWMAKYHLFYSGNKLFFRK